MPVKPAQLDNAGRAARRQQVLELEPVVVELEQAYQDSHQVGGITFVVARKQPLAHASDADNAIFTGMYLAMAAYRYAVTADPADLDAAAGALAGVRLLANASPVYGVLSRWVYPLDISWHGVGYDKVKSLENPGNTWGQRMADGQVYEHNGNAFHTRTTKDQLSGVVFGLAAAYSLVPELRPEVGIVALRLQHRLMSTDWSLRDHMDRTGTNAHKVDAPLKLALKALCVAGHGGTHPRTKFFDNLTLNTFYYNRSIMRTFAYNLHMMNAHSLFLLRRWHHNTDGVMQWQKKLWGQVAGDSNPHFAALQSAFDGKHMSKAAWDNLIRRTSEPYPGFFSWEKAPDEWWGKDRAAIGPGVDVMLPYWMHRYYTR